jgi:DNA-binding CsgD family transcriptional regulator/PAS domain-containing protein
MSELAFLKRWIQSRAGRAGADGGGLVREFEQFFTYIFDGSPDGISILDLGYTILGVNTTMERWYAHAGGIVGRKCHEVFHGRSAPCETCPTASCIASGRPQTGVVPYEETGAVRGTQQLSAFPLFDDAGRLFCVIEYVREISALGEEQRTIENLKRRIQFQDRTLQEQEAALEVLLRRSDRAERRAATEIAANLSQSIAPLVARLKKRLAGSPHAAEVEELEGRLRRLSSPLLARLPAGGTEFTPREREIAVMVSEGRTSKEIAERLCLTIKAVDFHRMNLRRKLGMGGSAQGLASRLSELDEP